MAATVAYAPLDRAALDLGHELHRLPTPLRVLIEGYAVDRLAAALQLQSACRNGDVVRIEALRRTGYAKAFDHSCWAWACEGGAVAVARALLCRARIAVPMLGSPQRVYEIAAVERRATLDGTASVAHRTVVDSNGLHAAGRAPIALYRIARIDVTRRRPSRLTVSYAGGSLEIYTGRTFAAYRRFELSVLASSCN